MKSVILENKSTGYCGEDRFSMIWINILGKLSLFPGFLIFKGGIMNTDIVKTRIKIPINTITSIKCGRNPNGGGRMGGPFRKVLTIHWQDESGKQSAIFLPYKWYFRNDSLTWEQEIKKLMQ